MSRKLLAIIIALQFAATIVTERLVAQQPKAPAAGSVQAAAKAQAIHNHAGHDHGSKGPNKGDLLEIGRGEYHGELVIDEESKQVIIYLLDSSLKSYVAIDAPFVTVNFKSGTQPAQVKLLPVPQESDVKGASSRFGLITPGLFEALHDGKSDAKLTLRIGKKSYVSKLTHSHGTIHTGQKPSTLVPKNR